MTRDGFPRLEIFATADDRRKFAFGVWGETASLASRVDSWRPRKVDLPRSGPFLGTRAADYGGHSHIGRAPLRHRHFLLDSILTADVLAVGDAGYRGAQTGGAAHCGPRPDRAIETDPYPENDPQRRSQTVGKQGLTMDP